MNGGSPKRASDTLDALHTKVLYQPARSGKEIIFKHENRTADREIEAQFLLMPRRAFEESKSFGPPEPWPQSHSCVYKKQNNN